MLDVYHVIYTTCKNIIDTRMVLFPTSVILAIIFEHHN
jgi:hypothetical protein